MLTKNFKLNSIRDSNGALNPAGINLKSNPAAEQRGIISNGVNSGMTLIELMVSLSIFLVVLVIMTAALLTSVKNQRQSFITQNLQDNARYAIETVAKEVRMSNINSNSGESQQLRVTIINESGQQNIIYRFSDDGKITRQEVGSGGPQDISGSQINIVGKFYVVRGADQKPRATILMRVYPVGASSPMINLETTVVSRGY